VELFAALGDGGDRLALATPDGRLSWRELSAACAGHLQRLREAGVEPGQRVALWAHPTLGTMAALVGNLVAGVVTVPLNPKLGDREREHILRDAKPVAVYEGPELVLAAGGTSPGQVDDRPALVIYTSGTTGAPKGAILTVRNVVACLDGLAEAWAWTRRDVVVHALPLFHVHGLVLGLLGSLRVGGAMRSIGRFEVPALAEALAAEGTMLFAVPTMYHRLAEQVGETPELVEALRRARLLVSGSAALAARDARVLREVAGVSVRQRYGLTETLINCAARADRSVVEGTVGPPLPGVELRVVDDERRPLAQHDIGEIAVRGANVFPGYLDRPEATAAVMDEDGWFYTGDIGHLDENGELVVHGRRSTDLIKTGGYKVGAGEVEACLLDHPAVAEAAVIGVDDPDLGERIVAFVVSRGDECRPDELSTWVAGQLSPHKRPREVRVVAELPRNAMGKVQKRTLAELFRG